MDLFRLLKENTKNILEQTILEFFYLINSNYSEYDYE